MIDMNEASGDNFSNPPSDLFVNHVERRGENEFAIQAFLMKLFNDTDEFKDRFKSYVESSYELDKLFDDSKITVNLINATASEFNNETLIWFELKTDNINVTDDDMNLFNYSIFDELFENFDVFELEAPTNEDELVNEVKIILEAETEMKALTEPTMTETTTTTETTTVSETATTVQTSTMKNILIDYETVEIQPVIDETQEMQETASKFCCLEANEGLNF